MESRRQLGDTIWNDSVQDTFYGATFGDSIPMVKEKLEKNGFRFVSHGSDKESLCFMPKSDRTFNFSNMIWTTLYIQSSRDCKFIGILFLSSFYDKEGALSFYDDLKSYVKYQYALTEVKVTDPPEYAMSYALGKNEVCANLMCYQFVYAIQFIVQKQIAMCRARGLMRMASEVKSLPTHSKRANE